MSRQKGFTLIEVMIVVAIVVTLSVMGAGLLKNTFRSKSRELSWRMASTIKYLYNSAITENQTVRLVLDFESNSYWAEATAEKFLLEKEENVAAKLALPDEKKSTTEETKTEGETAGEGEAEESAVEPIEPTFGSIETPLLEIRQLPAGLYLKDVYTSHDREPLTSGKAYIYFFQNGSAEAAVINFKDGADEKHLSIRINPFNGEADIAQEYRKQ